MQDQRDATIKKQLDDQAAKIRKDVGYVEDSSGGIVDAGDRRSARQRRLERYLNVSDLGTLSDETLQNYINDYTNGENSELAAAGWIL